MNIPKSFQLMGHTITVEVLAKKDWKIPDCVALFNPAEMSIKILRQPRSKLMHAFWHEAMHAMLYVQGHKLYSNENFVDSMGGLIAQLMESKE